METLLTHYYNIQTNNVIKHIESIFVDEELPSLTKKIIRQLLEDDNFLAFHEYYLEITNNPKKALANRNFFSNFKSKYSLQGIDNKFLEKLENDKVKVIDAIINNPEIIYTSYFQKASLTHKGITVYKDLGSFVTKLAHTFCPDKFVPLDNPIKNLLGLKNEGFYFSFLVVNNAYAKWLKQNQLTIKRIKLGITLIDTSNQLQLDSLTDLKILDTFLWQLANRPELLTKDCLQLQ